MVRRLAGAGHEVVVFHRGLTETELPDDVGRILGDRRDLADPASFDYAAEDAALAGMSR